MPSVNVLRNVNLAVPTQGAGAIRRNSVPFSSVNYIFEEYQATGSAPIGGRLVMDLKNGQVFDITDNATGNFTVQPNTTVSSSLVSTLPWPYLGSFSMSLSISGSDFQYAASSSNSSSLLAAEFVADESTTYYITSSIGYVGTCTTPWLNPTGSCGANLMKYSTLSLDEANNKWYLTNAAGGYTPDTSSFGIITGSASVVNANKNGCNYPGVQFSGSATFPLSAISVHLAIVTGSFTLSGVAFDGGNSYEWAVKSEKIGTSYFQIDFSTNGAGGATTFSGSNVTNVDSLLGIELTTGVGPFNRRNVAFYVSGSFISQNPPVTSFNFPYDLGSTFTLSGEGIITEFGEGSGSVDIQTQYNCLNGSTPSK
jgi:hypothetical protein